jgi:DNA invertase Pin-like site-specific DNA recombinase
VLAAARLDRFGQRRDDAGLVRSEDGAEALRLKLASSRDSRKRVPEELRAEAVAFAKAEHAKGRRYKSIASALGVKAETLIRWCRRRGTMCDVGAFEMQL